LRESILVQELIQYNTLKVSYYAPLTNRQAAPYNVKMLIHEGNAIQNKKVLSCVLKDDVLLTSLSSTGNRFQACGAATENARSPIVSFVLGILSKHLPADHSDARPGMSATKTSSSSR
jgi:hypothetical protein